MNFVISDAGKTNEPSFLRCTHPACGMPKAIMIFWSIGENAH